MTTETSDPATIERELEQTRARLGGHLDELQAKLSPGQLIDEGIGYLRHSQGADFFRNLGESAAEKPLPLALAGIGLAWLIASGAGPRQPAHRGVGGSTIGHDGFDELAARVRDAGASVTRLPDETDEAYRLRVNMARGYALGLSLGDQEDGDSFATRIDGALSDTRQRMSDAASHAQRRMSDAASHAQRRVSDAAQGLRDQASDMGDRLGASARAAGNSLSQGSDMARRAGSSVVSTMTDNPVLLGVFGLAVGALLGALMPQSDQEARALGGAASGAGNAMGDAANEVMERGSRVAGAAMAAGQDAAREEGLMPGGTGNPAD